MINGVDINKLWLECSKRDIQFEPLIQTALQQLRINPSDYKCNNIILQRISAYDVRATLYPEPFRKTNPKNNFSGNIKLGKIKHTIAEWNIKPSSLCTHAILFGRTGGGKSLLIKSILQQILEVKSDSSI